MTDEPRVLVVAGGADDGGVPAMLGDAGFAVEQVGDLTEVRAALSTVQFDCVVSRRTGGDGTADITDVVRELQADHPDVPFVLFVPEAEATAAERLITAGLVDFVAADQRAADDRLVGRVRNAVARGHALSRAERQARLNEVIRKLNRALVHAGSREAIEEAVCEDLAASELYTFAWLAAVEDGLSLRAMGVDGAAVEGRGAVAIDEGTAFTEPVERAAGTETVVVEHDVADRGGAWEAALDRPFDAVAAVPVVYGDTVHGVLVLYADRVDAFDEEERHVLGELGETIGYALNAAAVQRRIVRREQELRRQNQRLERFASVVSHDLRNPLNVARGYLEVLEDADEEAVERIGESLGRMETIIDDVLELARQGETIEDPDAVDLAAVADRAWAGVETGEASLTVHDEVTVRADEQRLVRLLENLFRNAMEHADADEVWVGAIRGDDGMDAGAGGDEDAELTGLFVADDGPGIPLDERDEVFEMGHTDAADGTGFGLAIVAEIAGAHGWDAVVTESESGGARFEFLDVEPAAG